MITVPGLSTGSNCEFMQKTIAIWYEKSSLLEALLWAMQESPFASADYLVSLLATSL